MSIKNFVLVLILIITIVSIGCIAASVLNLPVAPASPPAPTPASPPALTISGFIRDREGSPLSNAKVSLTRDGSLLIVPNNPQYSHAGGAGEKGKYRFENVPAGEYTIFAEKDGSSGSLRYSGTGPTDIFLTDSGATPIQGGSPVPAPSPTQSPASSGYYSRYYEWPYKSKTWATTLSIPESLYNFYKQQPHDRQHNYAQYALSERDKASMKYLADMFRDAGSREGYSADDNVLNIVSFVQALPYTSDKVTTGFDEYPRYPIETLVDNGGDCEDTSILTAALLNEMGYEVVLLELPQHMGVGVKWADGHPGTYVLYEGAKYYYLETSGRGWKIGQLPDEYKGQQFTVCPLVQVTHLDLAISAVPEGSDPFYAYYRVRCDIVNAGTGTATNVSAYIATMALGQGENKTWPPDCTVNLGDIGEGEMRQVDATIRIPRNETSQVKCVLSGDGFEPLIRTTNTFST